MTVLRHVFADITNSAGSGLADLDTSHKECVALSDPTKLQSVGTRRAECRWQRDASAPSQTAVARGHGLAACGDSIRKFKSLLEDQVKPDATQRHCGGHFPPVSHVAMAFEAKRDTCRGRPEEQCDAGLSDVVDSVLLSCHAESSRRMPASEDVLAKLCGHDREMILTWLVQACDRMRFHESIFFSTVLMLDRYCAAVRETLSMDGMQMVLMAVMCTVMKTCTVTDEMTVPLRDQLLHLGRHQLAFDDILRMEHRVLQTLRFNVTVPTVLEFLDALAMPLLAPGESLESSHVRCVANFLIQLSTFDAPLHYRRQHMVLAAAALYLALCSTQAHPTLYGVLIQDVATVCLEVEDMPELVTTTAVELHSLWVDYATTAGDGFNSLMRKFGGSQMLLLSPPLASAIPNTWQI